MDHDDAFVRLVDQIRGRGTNFMLERIDPYRSLILPSVEISFAGDTARLFDFTGYGCRGPRRR
ncbi:hypothetical protein [Nonomuraea fuscirosea]|uniref:hypothetical protein n=1 Tax=Nonomuraea fuscirosea TaxID=1291556 RepID=UPI000D07C865|nr:hypothetical protein [Nonomuraea fuscirosea]